MLTRGDTLSGYRIEGVLGHGGMGIVYRATQLSLDRVVALKVVAPHLGEDPLFRERFQREGRIQAGLDHPNIITIYEAGDSIQGLFIAMRLVDGKNLKELMIGGSLNPARGLDILRQVADAIDSAHEAGLVHRDIKPQNILVGPRDHAYLADFGLTKPPGQRSLTQTGQLLGTLDYTSPEQIMGKPAIAQSDIYSFGAVLYECLTGVVPYPREAEGAVLYAHLTDPLPPASSVNRALPRAIDEPVARALAKEPKDRPASAVDLIETVRHAAGRKIRAEARRQISIPALPGTTPTTIGTASPPVVARGAGETPVDVSIVESGIKRRPARTVVVGPRIRLLLAALAVLAVLIAAGFALGRTTRAGSGQTTVRTSDLAVSLAPGWHQLAAPKAKYGMPLSGAVLAESGAGGGRQILTIGWVPGATATLVPSRTAARALGINSAHPQTTGLGGGVAYAYAGPKRNLVAFFLATTQGDLAVVCQGTAAGTQSLSACKSIAAGLQLLRAKPLSPGPSASYAKAVRSALQNAAVVRGRERASMAAASTQSDQAAAGRRIATAYAKAASTLSGAGADDPRLKGPTAAIVRALRNVSASYNQLAAIAAAGNSVAYLAAAARVEQAEGALNAKVFALRALGYRLAPTVTKVKAVGPKAVTPAELQAFAASVHHVVYWVGPQAGDTYELTQTRDGLTYVRYLPPGAPVGTTKTYLKIGTYPVQDALAATRAQLKSPGWSSVAMSGGAVAVYSHARPSNIYVAYPDTNFEIEVFDPSAADARRLVTSGALMKVG